MSAENIDFADTGREPEHQNPQPDDLLSSWKEIAAYLNRDVRTVRRWEADQGLPVRRHQHQRGASVYAYRSELDVWWKGEQAELGADKVLTEPETGSGNAFAHGLLPSPALEVGSDNRPIPPRPGPRGWSAWPLLAVFLVIAIALAAYWLSAYRPVRNSMGSGKIMLAVLPFQNLTGDPSQEFVSDGLTEELSTQISELGTDRLGVIARTSVMAYKGTTKPVSEIARDLGVDYVLEGSVRRWGDRARISAQLIDARSQTHVWAENFESDQQDVLKLQDQMAQSVARSVDVALLTPAKVRSPSNPRPVDPGAHDLYLRGRYHLNQRSREDLRQSLTDFQQALARDPGYAPAYAGLAQAYNLIGFYGFDLSLDSPARAKTAALQALQLDPGLSSAHAALAYTEFMWQEDWPGAKSEFQRALELDDNDVPAHQWFGLYLAAQGQMGDALDQMQYAKRLDPLSPAAYAALAYTHYLAHNYDQAVHEAETAVRLKPDSMVAHAVLGWSYTEQKKYPAAIEELRTAATLSGNVPIYRCALARAYALSGDPKRAQEILSRVESALDEPRGAGSALAGVYLALGNSRMALHWLEKTAPGDIQANWLRVDPEFDPLRANPRFAAVLARAGKSPE